MSLIRQRLLIFFVPLLLAAPFLNRAYFVDDGYFVEIASWLKDHPGLPYHFRADDAGLQTRGWEENGFVRMVNPLVHHYYLALLLQIQQSIRSVPSSSSRLSSGRDPSLGMTGPRPEDSRGDECLWGLRLGCVFLSCFSAFFLFEFARRWTNTPLLATLLVLVTPVFWLTSYSLLIDSTLAFFAFGALYFFIRATEADGAWRIAASGLFAGLAILTKYPGVFVLALMMVWLALRWKKLDRRWRFFIPVLIGLFSLAAYSAWTQRLYGEPHILAASARMVQGFRWPKVFSFFVFLSGSFLIPMIVWGVLPAKSRVLAGLAFFVTAVFLSSKLGGFSLVQSALLGLWIVTSFLFIGAFWAMKPSWIFPRDHFLFSWLIGFVVMMLLVMDWVAVRYYCLAAPAVGLITVRLVEMRWPGRSAGLIKGMLGVVFLFTLALAVSDDRQAEPVRSLRTQLKADGLSGGERHFYLGDSFTMSYLKADAWVPCFPETEFQPGDLILAKEVTMPLAWFARRPVVLRQVAVYEYPSTLPLKVMDYAGSAGFYASVWGALPFTFSTGPWERFRLFEVTGLRNP